MAVDVQTFTPGTGTWTKPANALWTEMFAIGGGGAGGNGASGGAGTNRYGGGGGGSGAWSRTLWPAADLPATANVVCGIGGGGLGAQQRIIADTGQPPTLQAAGNNTLGLRFNVNAAGIITHVRYYREGNAAHTLSIWNGAGVKLGTVTDVASAAAGWRGSAASFPV